jgi:DNA polymerase III epsilon subunit-like protein
MNGIEYLVFDSETNGVNASYHEINEVSIIRCSNRVQLTEFIKCEFPERSSMDSLIITKKTLADLQKGSTKEKAIEKIDRFLNEDGLTPAHRCIVAHNSSFDRRFIWALYDKVGKRFPADLWMCSMAMTRHYAKQIGLVKPRVNLPASLEIVGIKKLAGAHASQVDSRNTYFLWKDLIENKKIDHLPFIKTAIHVPKLAGSENEALDPDLLDL